MHQPARKFLLSGIFSLPAAEIDIGRFGSFRIGRPVYSSGNKLRALNYQLPDLELAGTRVILTARVSGVHAPVLGADPDFGVQPRTVAIGDEIEIGRGRLHRLPGRAHRPPTIGLLPDAATFGPWLDPQACCDLDMQTIRLYATPWTGPITTSGRGRD
ncbi:hypothetical protein [Glycomyces sp. MUSA5-2]|uniref:hypothetical protein n=1 Tax=Glycomyces sp. MUSA5-2 TaxID=2053002 RepID=UPI003009393C